MTTTDKASVLLFLAGIIAFVIFAKKGENAVSICSLLVSFGSAIMIFANKSKRHEIKKNDKKQVSKNLLSDIFKPKLK